MAGVVGFMILTTVIATLPLTANSLTVYIGLTMFGYVLAILGMLLVAVAMLR